MRFHAPASQVQRGGGIYCSNRCRGDAVAVDPARFPQAITRRGRTGTRIDLGRFFRSSWEANYARYLNWLIERGQIAAWDYECRTYEFHKIKRGSRHYTPDFLITYLDGRQEWHEVKGYMDPRSATKLKRMARYYPQVRIVLIDAPVYREIAKRAGALIRGWE